MKKLAKWSCLGLALFTIVAAATFVGNMAYKKYVNYRFGSYVTEYSHRITHDAAHIAFNLAKGHLSEWKKADFAKRLAKLEKDYQHPYRAAVRNLFDDEFLDKVTDSYDDILRDITFTLGREEKEVWELRETQRKVAYIAWPYICEGFTNPDGHISTVDYSEYLEHRKTFTPLERDEQSFGQVQQVTPRSQSC